MSSDHNGPHPSTTECSLSPTRDPEKATVHGKQTWPIDAYKTAGSVGDQVVVESISEEKATSSPWLSRSARALALTGLALVTLTIMEEPDGRLCSGMIGLVGACYLFQSPFEGHVKIVRDGRVGEFPRANAIVSVFNCAVWVTYLYLVDLPTPLVTNAIGFLANLYYACVYARYDEGQRTRAAFIVLLAFGFYFVVLMVAMLLVPLLEDHGTDVPHFPGQSSASSCLGVIGLITNVMMYAAPLYEVGTVIKAWSTESMPTDISVGVLAMSSAWLVFGFLVGDWPIIVPNVCGVFVGAVQLVLIAIVQWTPNEKVSATR